ncbi:hypothetical protein F66182_37 [Fusarium sp. NRRL 66182]|nr:hypothetical protein F66182_37 [Fusarium sp. NRRL 66182]
MASSPTPSGDLPSTSSTSLPNGQPTQANTNIAPQAANNPQAAQNGQVQVSRQLLPDMPSVSVELLTVPMRQRLEDRLEREARTQQDLEAMGIVPGDYDNDCDMDAVGEKVANIEIEANDQAKPQKRIKFSKAYVDGHFEGDDPYNHVEDEIDQLTLSLKHTSVDLITALCCNLELAIEIGKHLAPSDIISLYVASGGFRKAVNGHMLSCIRLWIDTRAPEAGKVFHWRLYGQILIRDPAGRRSDQDDARYLPGVWETEKLNPDKIRLVPGLKYLQMVISRDRYIRQILALMARMGFRMPDDMYSTLLRIWLLMDISTTRHRSGILRNKRFWTDQHLYNAQFFFVKLAMAFTHPYFSPINVDMVALMMGQKGLYPLWEVLMRRSGRNVTEIMEMKARYDMRLPLHTWTMLLKRESAHVFGVEIRKLGIGHTEGWGKGVQHLLRPDELVPIESVFRGLHLDDHLTQMIIWGYIDFETGENVVPTEEEMYMSDEEETMAQADNAHHWQRKHALKKRWTELTPQQQQEIKDDDRDGRLRAMAWSSTNKHDDSGEYESESESDTESDGEYDMNAEIECGYRMPKADAAERGMPEAHDIEAWRSLCKELILDTIPEVNEADHDAAKSWETFVRNEQMRDNLPANG